ncbi:MAG: hypothetical protein VX346_20115 [Planctomycetota bacterium]|nr:hypothetical protein [Planctomycetota bacterium]
MANNLTMIREVSWREIFPWLILLRVFRLAIRPSVLLIALVPIILMPCGSWCAEQLFDHTPDLDQQTVELRVTSLLDLSRVTPDVGRERIESLFHLIARPFREILGTHSLRETAYWLFVGLWAVLLWAIPAGALSRIAVVRLGREERVGFVESLVFSVRRIGAYIGAPLLPLVGFALFALPVALVGLMMRADWGVLVAAVSWVLVLLVGFAMTLMLLGLFFGWPLMWPTISAEFNGDLFEALQRSYDYTRERPLHYLFYAFVATMLGALGWLIVNAVCNGIVDIGSWAVTWGAGVERMAEIRGETESTAVVIGVQSIDVLNGLVLRQIPMAYAASFFWCSASAIYLLLRQGVDQTEMDEVFLEEPEEEPPLPDLDTSFTANPASDE